MKNTNLSDLIKKFEYSIPEEQHDIFTIPARALKIYKENEAPLVAICLYENDYYVIESSGQGPYIIWSKEDMYDDETTISEYLEAMDFNSDYG